MTCVFQSARRVIPAHSIYTLQATTPFSHDFGPRVAIIEISSISQQRILEQAEFVFKPPTVTAVDPSTLCLVNAFTNLTILGTNFGNNIACWCYWQLGSMPPGAIIAAINDFRLIARVPRPTPATDWNSLTAFLAWGPGTNAYTTLRRFILGIAYPTFDVIYTSRLEIVGGFVVLTGKHFAAECSSYTRIGFTVPGELFLAKPSSCTATSVNITYAHHRHTWASLLYSAILFWEDNSYSQSVPTFAFPARYGSFSSHPLPRRRKQRVDVHRAEKKFLGTMDFFGFLKPNPTA